MCDKKELSKEEKIEKAKKLIDELNSLELSEDELNEISAGVIGSIKTPGVYDSEGIGMSGQGTF